MWNMMTVDGFFEGPTRWDLDWHGWGEELEEFSIEQLREVDMLLFGRATYEGMAAYWSSETGEIADFMNSIPRIVFSKTLEAADWNNTRPVKEDAIEEVKRLKDEPDKNLFVFGSAELCASLTREGLIDEYRIGLSPVALGGGNRLFKPSSERLNLKLLDARPLKLGVVILRYEPVA
jgi:dihydrofolate reductase